MVAMRRASIDIVGSLSVPSFTCELSEDLEAACPLAKFSHELEKSKHHIALSVEIPTLGAFFK